MIISVHFIPLFSLNIEPRTLIMVWQIDLSGKCIVVTGGNRVSLPPPHLPALPFRN